MYSKELESIKKSNRFRNRELFDDSLIDLASNDYLGLSTNKTLFKNAYENVLNENYHSPKASMLVNGYRKVHKKFEYRLCEVKSAPDYETAINNLTASKLSKIKRSVDYYLQTKKLDVAFCIDAIIVNDEEINFLETITL